MLSSTRSGVRLAIALLALLTSVLVTSVAASAPPPAPAQALPSPLRFASFLDLECFPTPPYQPPTVAITTRHLNPVLAHLPTETTLLGGREQLCVPVAKNNATPPPDVLPFIRFVDLACYRIQAQPANQQLRLNHLNPLFTGHPPHTITILNPVQLCVPVMKNGLTPPPEVRRLVSFIDLKCYTQTPPTPLNRTVTLTHLNPVLGHLPPTSAAITTNRQLCVPVQKNDQPIPPDILNIIRWIDLEKYDITTPPLPTPINLTLNHLNPLLAGLPTEPVTLTQARQLMLPVAKNGLIPPTT